MHLPLGLFGDAEYSAGRVNLKPGDRLVLLTDGMFERNAVTVDLPAAIADTRGLHPREAVRTRADRVLEATGNELSDDATLLCLDWHGVHGRDRDSHYGAEQDRASAPRSWLGSPGWTRTNNPPIRPRVRRAGGAL